MVNRIETEPYLLFKGAKNDIVCIESELLNKNHPIYEVKDVLKSLKKTYEYPLLKEARDILNKEHDFNTLPDNIMENILNMIS